MKVNIHVVSRPSIRTLIIDDVQLSRQQLCDLLEAETDIEVLAEYPTASAAMRDLPRLRPDLLFAGMELQRVSGFELVEFAQATMQPPPAVVLVTAFQDYAVKAFDRDVVDYLLKPFEAARLSRALCRVRQRLALSVHSQANEPSSVESGLAFESAGFTRFAVKSGRGFRVIRVEEVDWIETAGNYLRIHAGANSFLFREALHRMESALTSVSFVRINRSTLVNVNSIKFLEPSFHADHVVVLCDGTRLILAARYRRRLRPHFAGIG